MLNTKELVANLYNDETDIIIGLTGRTGSGCTYVSRLLEKDSFDSLNCKPDEDPVEALKDRIVFNFMQSKWKKFRIISLSNIILSFILETGLESFKNYLDSLSKNNIIIEKLENVKTKLNQLEDIFNEFDKIDASVTADKIEYYINKLTSHKEALISIFRTFTCKKMINSRFEKKDITNIDLFTYIFQQVGNNLRSSGKCYVQGEGLQSNPLLDRLINIINLIREQDGVVRVCIDSFRNPIEILDLKNKYVNFYVFAIKVDNETRKTRLRKIYTDEQWLSLDQVEYPSKYTNETEYFFKQNVQKCIELADIHFNNADNENIITKLIRYISLILHPGLISPTNIERCMQIAYSAKLSSGCLSRQVGAVVTDESFVIKSIGWNDVPCGQTPCALRNITDLVDCKNLQYFSKFERTNEAFKLAIEEIRNSIDENELRGRNFCFCFKDVYNAIEENKNQVHTRSLHAEENAFLGISKNGGVGIDRGILFVTASPCELCSKKSFQLNLSRIYYIDPYPGIAQDQILDFGDAENRPQIQLFYGAVGESYIKLFSQKLSIKDELGLLSGHKVKDIIENMNNPKIEDLPFDAIEFTDVNIELEFKTRIDIECKHVFKFVAKKENISGINRMLSWTGDRYLGTSVISKDLCHIVEKNNMQSSYHQYSIVFDKKIEIDKPYELTVVSKVTDLHMVMRPYFTHRIKNITKKLSIKIIAPKNIIDPFSVTSAVFADREMKQRIETTELRNEQKSKMENYLITFESPILNYSYGILWDFK